MNSISPSAEEATIATEGVAQDISQLSLEEQELQRSAWKAELAQIEDEIATLRTVLGSKMRRSAELKRNLGITVWKEISEDMNQGIKNVKESNVYQTVEQKVGQVTKAVTDAPIYQKTTSVIGGITGSISTKLGQMRHSESFKSIEERVGSAYENVKLMECGLCSETSSLNDVQSHPCFVSKNPASEENEAKAVSITFASENAKGKRFWSHDETMALIAAVENHYQELHNPKKKKFMWSNVATDMENRGYDISAEVCYKKWKNLMRSYHSVKEMHRKTGRGPVRFRYFDDIDQLLWDRPDIEGGANQCDPQPRISGESQSDEEQEVVYKVVPKKRKPERDQLEYFNLNEHHYSQKMEPRSAKREKKGNRDTKEFQSSVLSLLKRKADIEERRVAALEEYVDLKKKKRSK